MHSWTFQFIYLQSFLFYAIEQKYHIIRGFYGAYRRILSFEAKKKQCGTLSCLCPPKRIIFSLLTFHAFSTFQFLLYAVIFSSTLERENISPYRRFKVHAAEYSRSAKTKGTVPSCLCPPKWIIFSIFSPHCVLDAVATNKQGTFFFNSLYFDVCNVTRCVPLGMNFVSWGQKNRREGKHCSVYTPHESALVFYYMLFLLLP